MDAVYPLCGKSDRVAFQREGLISCAIWHRLLVDGYWHHRLAVTVFDHTTATSHSVLVEFFTEVNFLHSKRNDISGPIAFRCIVWASVTSIKLLSVYDRVAWTDKVCFFLGPRFIARVQTGLKILNTATIKEMLLIDE